LLKLYEMEEESECFDTQCSVRYKKQQKYLFAEEIYVYSFFNNILTET